MLAAELRQFAELVRKSLREQRFTLAFCMLLLAVFHTLGTYLYVTFGKLSMEALNKISPEIMMGLFGGLAGGIDPLETWLMSLFLHPLVLTLFSVVTVAVSTRALAGEVDRGTIDLLLSCPIPRWMPVVAAALVLIASHGVMTLILWFSMRLGLAIGDIEPPDSLPALRLVALNHFALFAGVSGVALATSAADSDQGRAMGKSIGFIVVSFFVNLIASLWDRVAWLDVVSVFHYHQPQPIIEGTAELAVDLGLLFGLGLAGLIVALVIFSRRDIATV